MKKLSLLTTAVLCTLWLSAKTIYLNTGGTNLWGADNATFFIHSWGNVDSDVQMTQLSGDVYSANIPDANNNLLFVRMASGATAIDWNNYWSKSPDMTNMGDENLCVISDGGFDGKGNPITNYTWSISPIESVDFAAQGYSNSTPINESYVGENFSVSFGGTNAVYYTNGASIRLYSGTTFTVTALKGTLTNIALHFGIYDGDNGITPSTGSYNSADGVWTGSASSVEFSVGAASGSGANTHRRLSSMIVTINNGAVISLDSDTITCSQALEMGNMLSVGQKTHKKYCIEGYIQSITSRTTNSNSNSLITTFYIADEKESSTTFYVYQANSSEYLMVGDKVAINAYIYRYNSSTIETSSAIATIEEKSPRTNVTLRLNPYSVSWTEAYLYVWVGSSYYESDKYVVYGQQAVFNEEDGWWTASVDLPPETSFYVGWSSTKSSSPNYYLTSSFTESTCFGLNYSTLKVTDYYVIERTNYTIRLNPFSFDWESAYLYVWRNGSFYKNAARPIKTSTNGSSVNDYSSSNAIVTGKQMILEEDGWWTYTFEYVSGASFCVGFDNKANNYPNYYDYWKTYSESTCFEYDSELKVVAYTSLTPNEYNTFNVHVATAGTFGQLMVQKLGDLTWTDIVSLTVTGLMNDDDMQYFSRMTSLQQLDLSGTNITNIGGFKDMKRLGKVVLPSSCVAINNYAFQNCKYLISINLDNVQTIGDYAFNNCAALTSADMPVVQAIGANAFNSAVKLALVTLPKATALGSYAFANCSTLVQVDIAKVKSLGTDAFYNAVKLEQVTLSDDLEVIPSYCFQSCTKLKTITLPTMLKEIGATALPTITTTRLPEGLLKVGSGNFTNAASINIPSTVTTWSSFSNTWKNVYCDVIVPPVFSVFNTDNVSDDALHVPVISLAAYKLHSNWYKFGKIVSVDGDVSDLNINGEFTLLTTDGLTDKVNITLNSGGMLTMSAEENLSVGNYIQQISSIKQYTREYDNDASTYNYYASMLYTGMLLANSEMTADNITVKLVPKSGRWVFFSLPFDVNMQDITIETQGAGTIGTSQWVIREYSGANRASGNGNTWNNVPANGVLKAHTGYILYWLVENSGTYLNNSSSSSVTLLYYFNMPAAKNSNMQKIFAVNDVDVPLTEYSAEFPQNVSWNLVGNPYPCLFNIQQMDFNAPITTWNGSGYTAYSIEDDNYMLRPAEAFFVQAPQGTNQITFHKEGRVVSSQVSATQSEYNNRNNAPTRLGEKDVRKIFNFILSNDDYADRARLVLNENASADYELTRDAAKMMSSDKAVPQLYINNNGIHYAIDERPENGTFMMGAYFGKKGEYTLHLNVPANEDRQIVLTDTRNNVLTDLTSGDYTFTTEAGTFDSRFTISFVNNAPSEMENTSVLNAPVKVMENGHLIIMTPQGKKYTIGGIEL